jgi:cyclopropane fatty-acyl-phospholipid synthase-like methyltransferase
VKASDRLLQRWRGAKALGWIRPGSHVLDVGCSDGVLFRQGRSRIVSGVGIDLVEPTQWVGTPAQRRTGPFPDVVEADETFDAIVMLAVVEHVDETTIKEWASACARLLRPEGRVIITVPAPAVDKILHVGMALRIFDGMHVHEHHGFEPGRLPELFAAAGLTLEHQGRFQLGLNNLFVFRR